MKISQLKTIEEILQKYEKQECKPTPMTAPWKLSIEDSPKTMEEIQFMKTISNLQIFGSCTRPDLLFSVGYLSRFMQNLSVKQIWEALKRVIRYLNRTKDVVITYRSLQYWNSPLLKGWLTSPIQAWVTSHHPLLQECFSCSQMELYRGEQKNKQRWLYHPPKPNTRLQH